MIKIEVYEDKKGELRWRAKSRGRTLADSGEGYKRRTSLVKALRTLFPELYCKDVYTVRNVAQ